MCVMRDWYIIRCYNYGELIDTQFVCATDEELKARFDLLCKKYFSVVIYKRYIWKV